jgi:hypothetical protein
MFMVTGCISRSHVLPTSQVLPSLSHAPTDRGLPVTRSDGSCCIAMRAIRICPAPQRSTTTQTTTMSAPPGWCEGRDRTRKRSPKVSPSTSRDSPTLTPLRIPALINDRRRMDYWLSLGYPDEALSFIASERAWYAVQMDRDMGQGWGRTWCRSRWRHGGGKSG